MWCVQLNSTSCARGVCVCACAQATAVVAAAADFFVSHLCRVVQFLGVLFTKSPFFITADDAEVRQQDQERRLARFRARRHEPSFAPAQPTRHGFLLPRARCHACPQAAAHAEGARSSLQGTAPPELRAAPSLTHRHSLKASKTGAHATPHGAHHADLDESEQLSESDVGALRDGAQPHCADALLAAVGLHPHPPHGGGGGSISSLGHGAGQGSLLSPAGSASFHTAVGGRSSVRRQSSQSGQQGGGGGGGGLGSLFRSSAAAALPTQATGAAAAAQQQHAGAGAGAAQSVSASQVPVLVQAAAAQAQADLARGPQRSAPFAAAASTAAPAGDGQPAGAGPRRTSLQQQQHAVPQAGGATPFLAVSRIPGLEDGAAAAASAAGGTGGAGGVVSPMLTLMPSAEFLSCVDNMSWVSSACGTGPCGSGVSQGTAGGVRGGGGGQQGEHAAMLRGSAAGGPQGANACASVGG